MKTKKMILVKSACEQLVLLGNIECAQLLGMEKLRITAVDQETEAKGASICGHGNEASHDGKIGKDEDGGGVVSGGV